MDCPEGSGHLTKRGALESDPLGHHESALPDYWVYLRGYRPLGQRLGVSYRDLDKALWKWNAAGMP